MKKAITFITVLCIILTSFAGTTYAQTKSTAKSPPLTMQILGKKVGSDTQPVQKGGKLYLPLRVVGEGLGYKVNWNSTKKTMVLASGKENISVVIGKADAVFNGKKVILDSVPFLSGGRAYLSMASVQKYLNCTVKHDNAKNIVYIDKNTAVSYSNKADSSKGAYILGKKISSLDITLLKGDKRFVPLRMVGEALGYKVDYDSVKKIMRLSAKDKSVSVTIGKTEAIVNSKKVKLDAAPFIYGGKAYVTLKFIEDNLNYEASYDKSKKVVTINYKKPVGSLPNRGDEERPKSQMAKIQDISYDESGGYAQLNIVADNPVSFNSFSMDNPDRLVVDIPNAIMDTEFENKEIGKGGIIRVRIGQFGVEPNIVRVVIDLENKKDCKLVQSDDKKTISLIYANFIKPITLTREGLKDVITIKGSDYLDSNVFKLDNPDRLVIDIKMAVLEQPEQNILSNALFIKTIRTGQFDVGTARVVAELQPGVYFDVKSEGTVTKVYVSDIPFNLLSYDKYYNYSFVKISPGGDYVYRTVFDEANRIYSIIIDKNIEVEERRFDINDNLLEYMQIRKQYSEGRIETVADFKLKDKVIFEMQPESNSKLVKFKLKRLIQNPQDLTIVIDPGHGGKDPGAVAEDGTTEKSLSLDVANRLNEKLKALGFKTVMTRTDDSYVSLGSRTDIANGIYADFFMSIHFNAFNSTAKGIEVLYFPNTTTAENPVDNRQIAAIFHSELMRTLQRTSRGIVPRPNLYVLNKTKMPAILAELGFITNTEELSKIKTEEYRNKAADALAVSMIRYFREIENINLNVDIQTIYSLNAIKEN